MKKEIKRPRVFNRDGSKAPTVKELETRIAELTKTNMTLGVDVVNSRRRFVELEQINADNRMRFDRYCDEIRQANKTAINMMNKQLDSLKRDLKIANLTIDHLRAAVLSTTEDQMDTTQALCEARTIAVERLAGKSTPKGGCGCGMHH